LLLCKNLEEINLFQTSQSVAGYAQLLQVLKQFFPFYVVPVSLVSLEQPKGIESGDKGRAVFDIPFLRDCWLILRDPIK
jgi:hypothetical protein